MLRLPDLLLFTIRRCGPIHGLEIIRALKSASLGRIKIPQGSIYPALERLEERKLVRFVEAPVDSRGGRPRKMYRLTTKGSIEARSVEKSLESLRTLRGAA